MKKDISIMKRQPTSGRYKQIRYWIRRWYLKYINKLYNSIWKKFWLTNGQKSLNRYFFPKWDRRRWICIYMNMYLYEYVSIWICIYIQNMHICINIYNIILAQSYPTLCDPIDCSMPGFPISWNVLRLMSIESVMPSNHRILCCSLLLLSPIFPSIRVFSNESGLHIRWPKYWSFSFSISLSNAYSGLNASRID